MKRIFHVRIAKRADLTSAIALALSICAGSSAISPTGAQTIGSFYTSTALKDCRVSGAHNGVDDSTTRFCPGKAGLGVLLSEDDLRETVSVGRSPAAAGNEPAAQAWFGPFNSSHATVEWRALDGKPFAIIQRWHLDDDADEDKNGRPTAKPMLVVTRLPPGLACHVAYVDVKANRNAQELARQAADEVARGFKCGKIKVIGESGRAVELALLR
jgi:hypothetical protein